jgi:hypothetical protein
MSGSSSSSSSVVASNSGSATSSWFDLTASYVKRLQGYWSMDREHTNLTPTLLFASTRTAEQPSGVGAAALNYARGGASWALSADGKQAAAAGAPFSGPVAHFITVMRVGSEPFTSGSMQVLHNIRVAPTLCDVHIIRWGL